MCDFFWNRWFFFKMHAFLAKMQLCQQKINDLSANMCDFLVKKHGFFCNIHVIILEKICDFLAKPHGVFWNIYVIVWQKDIIFWQIHMIFLGNSEPFLSVRHKAICCFQYSTYFWQKKSYPSIFSSRKKVMRRTFLLQHYWKPIW